MIKAILTKPLDGQPEGTVREFDKQDFDALKAMGAVRAAPASEGAKEAAPVERNKAAPSVERNKSR